MSWQAKKIETRKLSQLNPYANNPRIHSDSQIEKLCDAITEFGFTNPILVDNSNEVIAGHGRLIAAKKLGMEHVPVIVIGHLSDRQKKALVISDNKITSLAMWDFDKLGSELSALADMDFDLSLTAMDEQEIDSLLKADVSILPDSYRSDLLATEGGRSEPSKQDGELVPVSRPKTTDNEFSTFELVMNHQNKLRLVEVLSRIREEHGFTKLEDALMQLVKFYEEKD